MQSITYVPVTDAVGTMYDWISGLEVQNPKTALTQSHFRTEYLR